MISAFGEDVVPPSGLIIPWDGSAAEVPSGWAICDGNNGTPNMLDRFPIGGDSTGTTGGQHSHTLSTSQLPSHTHASGSVYSAGKHNHIYYTYDPTYDVDSSRPLPGQDVTTSTAGSHSHSMSAGSAGGGASIDNQPAFYEMLFIQKL